MMEHPLVGYSNGGYMTMGMVWTTEELDCSSFDIMKLLIFVGYIVIEYDTYKRGELHMYKLIAFDMDGTLLNSEKEDF